MNYIFAILKKITKHELISGSLFIFLGTTIANILSFLFNLLIVRNLKINDYATYASLISAITLISIPTQSFQTILVRFAADYFSKNKNEEATSLYIKAFKFLIMLGLFIIIISKFAAPLISKFLNIENDFYIFLTGITVSVGYIGVVNIAFLQSLLKFSYLSFLTVLGTLLKLLFGILFIQLGFKVEGALFSVAISFLVPTILGIIPLKKVLRRDNKQIELPIKQMFKYALPAAIAIISLSSFTSMDIILVKHFFNSSEAGLYAGIGLVGRVIFYFTMPIPLVMFPLVIKNKNADKPINNLLLLSLFLVGLSSAMLTLFYFLFPEFSVRFFLGGSRYLSGIKYLSLTAIYLSLFSVVNVLVNFFLSLQILKVTYFVATAAFLQIVLIIFIHNNLYQIITLSSVLVLVLLLTLLLYYFRLYGKRQIS